VAWVASCILYDRAKLLAVGGFRSVRLPLPLGEEVLVQNLLMRHFGGCAVVPAGTYHAEMPSTVLNAAGTDGHALALLPEMIECCVVMQDPLPILLGGKALIPSA
jgi:hypothetical protein